MANAEPRQYDSGALRDTQVGKPQYESYLSPFALYQFGQYMLKHQQGPDGKYREGDNWQKGIPLKDYADSLIRHVFDFWREHRRGTTGSKNLIIDLLCAIIFNAQGYLHELVKDLQPEDPKVGKWVARMCPGCTQNVLVLDQERSAGRNCPHCGAGLIIQPSQNIGPVLSLFGEKPVEEKDEPF